MLSLATWYHYAHDTIEHPLQVLQQHVRLLRILEWKLFSIIFQLEYCFTFAV